jgi:hypothetical protein
VVVVPPEGSVVVVARLVVVVLVRGTVVVVVAFAGMPTVGAARLAMKPTITVEATPELMKTVRVKRRTRAKRRSRCWGVREWVFMRSSTPQSLTPLPKRR